MWFSGMGEWLRQWEVTAAQLLAGVGPGTAEAHRLELVQVVPEHLFRVPIGSGHQQPRFLRREKMCDGSGWLPLRTGSPAAWPRH